MKKINTGRNVGWRVGEAASGGYQDPHQAPTALFQVPVNRTRLTDGEVREALL